MVPARSYIEAVLLYMYILKDTPKNSIARLMPASRQGGVVIIRPSGVTLFGDDRTTRMKPSCKRHAYDFPELGKWAFPLEQSPDFLSALY